MAKEQQYIQQLTDLGVYDPAFDGAIHVLCIQERELSRAMKEWKATAPDPKAAPSITNPLYAEISKLRRDILIDIDNSMADRGYLNGDEVREDADRDPVGLTEYKVLENYIPYDMSGNQLKLAPKEDKTNA